MNEVLIHGTVWFNQKNSMLNLGIQIRKVIYCMTAFTLSVQNRQIQRQNIGQAQDERRMGGDC